MRVVERLIALRIPQPHDVATEPIRTNVRDKSVGRRYGGGTPRSEDVDAVVLTAAAITCGAEAALDGRHIQAGHRERQRRHAALADPDPALTKRVGLNTQQ